MALYTKRDAISIVVACAERYRDELDGRNLLLLCTDKHRRVIGIELTFLGSNFLHLTGLKIPEVEPGVKSISATDFYRRCLEHKLSENDFELAADGTTQQKLEVLPGIITRNLQARMVGDYNSYHPKLYTETLAGGTKACMGFVEDAGQLHPNTVLNLDIRDVTKTQLRVIAVFRKDISAARYEELTYIQKKAEWERISFPSQYTDLRNIVDFILGDATRDTP